jgi:hypothetical protein
MFPFWLFTGIIMILLGIFNKQILRLLGLKPMSEILTIPNLKHSSRIVEQLWRWLVITLGVSFLVQGLGKALPGDMMYKISLVLLGLSGLLLLGGIGITIANWKAK